MRVCEAQAAEHKSFDVTVCFGYLRHHDLQEKPGGLWSLSNEADTKMMHHGAVSVKQARRSYVTSSQIPAMRKTTDAFLTETTESSQNLELSTEKQLE